MHVIIFSQSFLGVSLLLDNKVNNNENQKTFHDVYSLVLVRRKRIQNCTNIFRIIVKYATFVEVFIFYCGCAD